MRKITNNKKTGKRKGALKKKNYPEHQNPEYVTAGAATTEAIF